MLQMQPIELGNTKNRFGAWGSTAAMPERRRQQPMCETAPTDRPLRLHARAMSALDNPATDPQQPGTPGAPVEPALAALSSTQRPSPGSPQQSAQDALAADRRWLALLLAASALALLWVVAPFFGAVLWGGVLALLFEPVHRRLRQRLPGRPNTAAACTLLAVMVVVVVPCMLVGALLAIEARTVVEGLTSGTLTPLATVHEWHDTLPRWVRRWLRSLGMGDFAAVQARLVTALRSGSQFIATQVFTLGQDTFAWIASLGLTLYLSFFVLRDGAMASRWLSRLVPMTADHQQALLDRFQSVVRATVRGTMLVAVLQGALGGLAFWVLDVQGAVLWGVLMAFLSLVPAVGSALVWAPVAALLYLNGEVWQAAGLTAYGVLVIGLVDNLVRPLLVGRGTRLPDSLVMLTTLGGLALVGLNGFIVGPAIAALFIAAAELHATPAPGARA
jgi:predicted PurR-regulated permease PerM